MPEFGQIYCSIWDDADFLALPPGAQRMYMFLITQRDLSMCGALHLRERYWASKADGLTAGRQRADLDALAAARFVVIDDDTEELLVRAKIRRDIVLAGPKLIKPLIRACEAVASGTLRGVIAAELRRCLSEGLVNPKISHEVERLTYSCEHSSRYATTALFPVNPQVDTVSDTVRDTVPDTVADRSREKGVGRGFRSEGGYGGEIVPLDGMPAGRPGPKPGTDDDPGFVRFWATFPRKTAKGTARTAYAKAIANGADPRVLIAAAADYRDMPGREPRYTCHPATWLNQQRWEDDPSTAAGHRAESGFTMATRIIAENGAAAPQLSPTEEEIPWPPTR